MSPCLFIHDFFQDGRLDVLAEIRILQLSGDWTKEKRACWIKQAKAVFERSKHTHPHIPQGSSYHAGRIAGLKSAITAHYPSIDPHGKMLFLPLPGNERSVMCLSCGDEASWKCHKTGSFHGCVYLCDRCKQERVRDVAVYERELLPLPEALGDKLIVKEELHPAYIFAPCTATIGLATVDIAFHIPVPILLLQILFVLYITVKGKDYLQEFHKLFESEP